MKVLINADLLERLIHYAAREAETLEDNLEGTCGQSPEEREEYKAAIDAVDRDLDEAARAISESATNQCECDNCIRA